MITAVILAAGQAKRMGRAKQLLPWGDSTVLGQTIRHLKQSNCTDILVVTGYCAKAVQKVAHQEGVPTVFNPHFATGEMLSSLQTAVYALPAHADAILVALADQPMIQPQTYNHILAPFLAGQADLITPYFQNRRGNPVLIGKRYFAELLALPQGDAPRTLLKRHASEIWPVRLDTPTILQDLDKPEDYERWRPSSDPASEPATCSSHID